ncbi:MAG TPA: Spy/CpxP family protein refolding chaperone [Chthoniobacteraceae bacterium]|jgi:Spy/CpxP family protein refolding chaperone
MKKLFLILSFAALGSLAVPSLSTAEPEKSEKQEGRGGRGNPEERLARMKEHLKLTDEQAEKVKAIMEKGREEGRALREDKSSSDEDRRAKMKEFRKSQMEQIDAVLTPEQREKAKEMRKDQRKVRRD